MYLNNINKREKYEKIYAHQCLKHRKKCSLRLLEWNIRWRTYIATSLARDDERKIENMKKSDSMKNKI